MIGRFYTCRVEDCDKPSGTRGWCSMHYGRVRRHGSPAGGHPRLPWPQNVHARINRTGTCWLWTGSLNNRGYGQVAGPDGRLLLAHRAVYELFVGPIPEGLTIDHLCRVRACCNPAHLEPVTHAENVLRGLSPSAVHASATHCPQGHPYDDENTHLSREGWRSCKECNRSRARRNYARKKAER